MACIRSCYPSSWNETCWRDFCFIWTTLSRPDICCCINSQNIINIILCLKETMLVTKKLIFHLHESLDILTLLVWNSPFITLPLHLRGWVVTKGKEIIIFVKNQSPFDVHRQYLDVSLLDLQARVSRFHCRIFHCFVDFSRI